MTQNQLLQVPKGDGIGTILSPNNKVIAPEVRKVKWGNCLWYKSYQAIS